MTIRPAEQRGHAQHGWLDSHHTFSFADYYDPAHMGFRALRVINDDRVEGGQGFEHAPAPRHGGFCRTSSKGAIEHQDSMGTGSVIRPGDVQRMSAGTGVRHSEYNASKTEPVHFLQIWIEPSKRGLTPSYEQKTFGTADKQGRLRIVASPDGRGRERHHPRPDARLYAGVFEAGRADAELALAHRPPRLGARRARQGAGEREGARGGRRRGALGGAGRCGSKGSKAARSWSSTWREAGSPPAARASRRRRPRSWSRTPRRRSRPGSLRPRNLRCTTGPVAAVRRSR